MKSFPIYNADFRTRFVKNILKSIYFSIAYYFSLFVARSVFVLSGKNKNTDERFIVIVKPDAIGDYILFRNFIPLIPRENLKVVIIGNISCREIAEQFDASFINRFLGLERRRFKRNFLYRVWFLINAGQLRNVDTVLYPCFSREGDFIEDLIKIIRAEKKIAWHGDGVNMPLRFRRKNNKIYTQIYHSNEDVLFEFERNRLFFSQYTGDDLSEVKPVIQRSDGNALTLPEHYALFFIGAKHSFRQWSIRNYAEVATVIKKRYGLDIVIGGGPGDEHNGRKIEEILQYPCLNFVGNTTHIELVELISRSSLILSNETAIPHIAVALKHNNIFVISNGNHYGRFTPYPDDLCERYFAIYPPELEQIKDEHERISHFGKGSRLNIQSITPQRVIKTISKHIVI